MEKTTSFEEVLERCGRLVYTNVGGSMRPLLREGRDVLVIEKRESDAPKRYDVVLFRRENVKGRGEYVLHRILKKLPDGNFYIVGDHCTEGENVKPSQILGVLSGINRGGKNINMKGLRYKTYVALWCAPFRLRFAFLRVGRLFCGAFGALMRKFGTRR